MINVLKMNFDENSVPDVGSIAFDRYKEHLHLVGADMDKLNSVLTRANIATYGAEFYFQSGDVAIVDDTQRAFVYNSTLDEWTEWDI
jgi:hypothetical protein